MKGGKIPYPYRINFIVDEDTRDRATKLIKWGLRDRLMNSVLSMILDLLEKDKTPDITIGAIIGGHIKLEVNNGKSKGQKKEST